MNEKTVSQKKTKTHEIDAFERCIAEIRAQHAYLMERISDLETENEHLRSAAYAEEELSRMKGQCENLREALNRARIDANRGFPISEEQSVQIASWLDEHERTFHKVGTDTDEQDFHGTTGGNYSYEFIPTSIGTIGYIRCGACGEKLCFQEIS